MVILYLQLYCRVRSELQGGIKIFKSGFLLFKRRQFIFWSIASIKSQATYSSLSYSAASESTNSLIYLHVHSCIF